MSKGGYAFLLGIFAGVHRFKREPTGKPHFVSPYFDDKFLVGNPPGLRPAGVFLAAGAAFTFGNGLPGGFFWGSMIDMRSMGGCWREDGPWFKCVCLPIARLFVRTPLRKMDSFDACRRRLSLWLEQVGMGCVHCKASDSVCLSCYNASLGVCTPARNAEQHGCLASQSLCVVCVSVLVCLCLCVCVCVLCLWGELAGGGWEGGRAGGGAEGANAQNGVHACLRAWGVCCCVLIVWF